MEKLTFFRYVQKTTPNKAKFINIKSLNLERVENTGPIKLKLFNKVDYTILIWFCWPWNDDGFFKEVPSFSHSFNFGYKKDIHRNDTVNFSWKSELYTSNVTLWGTLCFLDFTTLEYHRVDEHPPWKSGPSYTYEIHKPDSHLSTFKSWPLCFQSFHNKPILDVVTLGWFQLL